MIRIVLVEETRLLRAALRTVLAAEGDLEVVADVADAESVVPVVRVVRPDVVVLKLAPMGPDVLATIRRISAEMPDVALLVLIDRGGMTDVLPSALRAGVRGLADWDLPPAQLSRLVRRVAAGERVIDPASAVTLLSPSASPLTQRELQVLRVVAEGLPLKETARSLFLAHGTVRNLISKICHKIGTRNRHEAVRRARHNGWL